MGNLKKVILVAAFTAAFNLSAQPQDTPKSEESRSGNWSVGGLFVEPAVTYEMGDTTVAYPAPLSSSTGDANGLGFGARLGLHLGDILFFGMDGRYSMLKVEDSSPYNADAKAWNLGPVVGVQTPFLGLRVWGSYVLWSELDPESSGSTNVKFADGTGYRLGAGIYVAMVSLNLEYQDVKYGKTTLEEFGPFAPGSNFSNVDLNNKTWIASVSFPIAL